MRFVVTALWVASCATTKPPIPAAKPPRVEQPAPPTPPCPEAPLPPPAPAPIPQDDVRQGVLRVLEEFAAAVGRRDADAIARLHIDGPDTVAIWPGVGEEIIGIEGLRAALRQEMAHWKSANLVITDHIVHVITSDAAVVWGHYDQELDATPPGARLVTRRVRGARFFALMTRQPDGWKMLIEVGSIPLNAVMFEALIHPPPFRQRKPKKP